MKDERLGLAISLHAHTISLGSVIEKREKKKKKKGQFPIIIFLNCIAEKVSHLRDRQAGIWRADAPKDCLCRYPSN